ncbi:MAG: hypothetical protein IPP63_04880 [Chloracidobacterium sp.]|nr:hypothetical protein [Chloracidobacterium sp.]
MKLAAALLLTTSFLGCSGASKMAEPTSSSRAEPNRAEAIVDEHLKRDAAPYRKDHIRLYRYGEGKRSRDYRTRCLAAAKW